MKELQGQFKTDFEKWLDKYSENNHTGILLKQDIYIDEIFYSLPIEMQFGVVQLFADSLGVDLNARRIEGSICSYVLFGVNNWVLEEHDTYPEAQQQAITQFEKWYNEQR